ncbi:MAG: AAA family ATPase [Bryobacterales bacterium]|nr:AAA family ATPase [Bryobacterales bacterium]
MVAGPNGSGKSTLSAEIAAGVTVIDPDAIARTIEPAEPSRAAIPAARRAILRCRELISQRESLIVESTLAGHGAIALMTTAKRAGYRTLLVYVALGEPELHIDRVRLRVAQGGHDIPDADIRRRYFRSLSRAPEAIRLADEAIVLDNAGPRPERVLMLRSGQITWKSTSLPEWVSGLVLRLA